MKSPKEMKPIFEGRLVYVGNGVAVSIPKAVAELWDLRKGSRYLVQILSEVKEAFYGFCSPNPI